jgi:hypothetical protein
MTGLSSLPPASHSAVEQLDCAALISMSVKAMLISATAEYAMPKPQFRSNDRSTL